jgi:hypothetical protein
MRTFRNTLSVPPSSNLPAYEDGTECSETSAYKIQTPGNCREENIEHSEQGNSLKTSKIILPNPSGNFPIDFGDEFFEDAET